MPTDGPRAPTAATALSGPGPSWTNVSSITADDAAFASVSVGATASNVLMARLFNFAVPAGKVIVGVTATVKRDNSATPTNQAQDNAIQLTTDGVGPSGTNKAAAVNWPFPQAVATYGGPADLWGLATLTPAVVNSPNFGVCISAKRTAGTGNTLPRVNYVTLSVEYADPPVPPLVPGDLNRPSTQMNRSPFMRQILGRTAMGRMLAVMQTALSLDDLVVKLMKEDAEITPDSLIGDFVSADYTGYASQNVANTGIIYAGPLDEIVWQAAELVFQPVGTITISNTIYGYWIEGSVGGSGARFVTGQKFDNPISMATTFDVLFIQPRIVIAQPQGSYGD